jgi:hypothetical protein
VNGKHESLITTWPQISTVVIQIRGLAGTGDLDTVWEEDDTLDPTETEEHYVRPKEKFPKGWVKIGLMGGIIRVNNNQTLEQACEPYGIQLEPEIWLPNGRRAAIDEKMRYIAHPVRKR